MLSVKIKKRLSHDGKSKAGEADGFLLDVTFTAPPGVTILFGASGSGKTTTLKSIAGLLRPDAGHIQIGEQVLFDSERAIDLPIRRRGVGYVFQNLALFPHLSARENVEFGMTGRDRRARREQAMALLRAFHVAHTAERQPRQISGGEAQRVAFARALASGPRLLLLDEPLSAIDEVTKLAIISDLKSLNRELRLPVIYVTHSREEAMTLGERVIVFERGRIVAEGEPLEVFNAPVRASVARLTGVENLFPGRVVACDQAGGTMTIEISDAHGTCQVEVPFGREMVGEPVQVAVPSGDILLALAEPHGTSARNRLHGRITAVEDKGARAVASIASGVLWHASLTRQAVNELDLHPGKEVWLAFKTHSCYLLD
ncbi:MAG TPA: molybdenum ABC transporter ATP-binding protein [Blastocatellia bacterium]|nr:molybdenum ABC transporter ATP-binding protein [Blastocatellia bacterium]